MHEGVVDTVDHQSGALDVTQDGSAGCTLVVVVGASVAMHWSREYIVERTKVAGQQCRLNGAGRSPKGATRSKVLLKTSQQDGLVQPRCPRVHALGTSSQLKGHRDGHSRVDRSSVLLLSQEPQQDVSSQGKAHGDASAVGESVRKRLKYFQRVGRHTGVVGRHGTIGRASTSAKVEATDLPASAHQCRRDATQRRALPVSPQAMKDECEWPVRGARPCQLHEIAIGQLEDFPPHNGPRRPAQRVGEEGLSVGARQPPRRRKITRDDASGHSSPSRRMWTTQKSGRTDVALRESLSHASLGHATNARLMQGTQYGSLRRQSLTSYLASVPGSLHFLCTQ